MMSALAAAILSLAAPVPELAKAPLAANMTNGATQLYCGTTGTFWCDFRWTQPGRYFVYFVQQPMSGFGMAAQQVANGMDQFDQVFFGKTFDTYYTGCCSTANCLWQTPSRWVYADVSKCAPSPGGAYLVFDVSSSGYGVVATNPNGHGPQSEVSE